MLPSSGPLATWLNLPVAGSMRKLAATIGSPRVAANRNFLSGLMAIGVEPAVLTMPGIVTFSTGVRPPFCGSSCRIWISLLSVQPTYTKVAAFAGGTGIDRTRAVASAKPAPSVVAMFPPGKVVHCLNDRSATLLARMFSVKIARSAAGAAERELDVEAGEDLEGRNAGADTQHGVLWFQIGRASCRERV